METRNGVGQKACGPLKSMPLAPSGNGVIKKIPDGTSTRTHSSATSLSVLTAQSTATVVPPAPVDTLLVYILTTCASSFLRLSLSLLLHLRWTVM